MNATSPIEQKILDEARKDKTLDHHECFGIAVFAQARGIEDYTQAKDFWQLLDEVNRIGFIRQSTCHTERLNTSREKIDLLVGSSEQIEAHLAIQPYRVFISFVEFMSLAIFVIKEKNRHAVSAREAAEYYNEWTDLGFAEKYNLIKVFLPAVPPLLTDY